MCKLCEEYRKVMGDTKLVCLGGYGVKIDVLTGILMSSKKDLPKYLDEFIAEGHDMQYEKMKSSDDCLIKFKDVIVFEVLLTRLKQNKIRFKANFIC